MKITIHPDVLNRGLFHHGVFEALSRDKLERVIKFARPPSIAGFTIEFLPQIGSGSRWTSKLDGKTYTVSRASFWSGRAYWRHNRIAIRVPIHFLGRYRRPLQFFGVPGSSGYQGVKVYSAEEALVYLVAHELRHLWQAAVARGRRVWGARGQFSERDADCYALAVVRRWRRGGLFHVEQMSPSKKPARLANKS